MSRMQTAQWNQVEVGSGATWLQFLLNVSENSERMQNYLSGWFLAEINDINAREHLLLAFSSCNYIN